MLGVWRGMQIHLRFCSCWGLQLAISSRHSDASAQLRALTRTKTFLEAKSKK